MTGEGRLWWVSTAVPEKNLAAPLSGSSLPVAERSPGGGGKAVERHTWIVPGKSFLNRIPLPRTMQYKKAALVERGDLMGAGETAAWC